MQEKEKLDTMEDKYDESAHEILLLNPLYNNGSGIGKSLKLQVVMFTVTQEG